MFYSRRSCTSISTVKVVKVEMRKWSVYCIRPLRLYQCLVGTWCIPSVAEYQLVEVEPNRKMITIVTWSWWLFHNPHPHRHSHSHYEYIQASESFWGIFYNSFISTGAMKCSRDLEFWTKYLATYKCTVPVVPRLTRTTYIHYILVYTSLRVVLL